MSSRSVAEEAEKSPVRPEVRLPLQHLMTEARAAGSALERAAEAGDRPAVARQVDRLAALAGELAAWQARQEGEGAMSMKKAATLALGILTSVGGFFDVGAIATSAQAGAVFRYQLLWALALGTILVIFLVEMSGRFAAVTRQALPDAIRQQFGFTSWLVPFAVLTLIHFLVSAPRSAASASPSTCSPGCRSRSGRSPWRPWSGSSSGGRPSARSRTARRCSA